MTTQGVSERARQIYKEAIVIDMLEAFSAGQAGWGPGELAYFQTLVDSGITATQATVPWVSDDLSLAIKRIAEFHKAMETAKNAKIAFTAADIESAKKEGKAAIIMGMQDSIPFERDLDLIRVFHKLGIRAVQMAFYQQNYLGAGCAEGVDHGLTVQGKEAVKEFNRLGILIDTSHCGDKTAYTAAKASEDPIAVTHSTASAIVPIPRGKSDETIKAVAEKGGVIGIVIISMFADIKGRRKWPNLSDYVDVIDYIAKLVGIDHVGLGTDVPPFWTKAGYDQFFVDFPNLLPHHFPFEQRYVKGFNGIEDTIKIAEELLRRGYSDEDAKKVLGSNWLRLVKHVWK